MHLLKLAVAATILAAGTAHADLAVDCVCGARPPWPVLYFLDHDQVLRADCPQGTTLFDRSTCAANVVSAPWTSLQARIDADYLRDLDHQRTARDLAATRLSRTEVKMQELLSRGTPTAPVDDLRSQLATEEQSRTTQAIEIHDLEDQLARAESEMRRTPAPDLALLSEQLATRLSDLRASQRDRESRIDQLRRQLIDAYGDLSHDADFSDLQHQHARITSELASIDDNIREAMSDYVEAKRQTRHLLDQGFAWENLGYGHSASATAGYAATLEAEFDATR